MVIMEESKTPIMEDEANVPFVEELTEEEFTQEMKNQEPELSPEQEEEVIKTLSRQNMLKKIQMELDGHEKAAKEGFIDGRYNYAYSEYKTGLKGLSDHIISNDTRAHPDLQARYQIRRRKFCINAAAACIKIRHFQQGLEACTLVLDEGPDDDMQRRKALFRAGVCARGMGELDAAKDFLTRLLDDEGGIDEKTKRDVTKQLRMVAEEKKSYKKFAREMCSKKNVESIILPSEVEKKAPTPKELEKMAEVEEKREAYLSNMKMQKEIEEKKKKNGGESSPTSVVMRPPEVMISEEDCISILDTLAERYADSKVQEALKKASLDHNLKFSKGYIIRSKQILAPLQKDIFEKYGFLDDSSENVESSNDKAKVVIAVKAPDISEFDETLGDLVLIGAGVREKSSEEVKRFETKNMYSVAVYSGEDAKTKIVSAMSSSDETESTSTLRTALKSSDQTTFLLKLHAEFGVQEMSGEFLQLVYPSKPDNSSLAQCSSLVFEAGSSMEKDVFPPGTTFKLECVDTKVKFSVDGNEIGMVHGLKEAFCDGFLDQETVGPSLRQSAIQHCCNNKGTEMDLKVEEEDIPEKDTTVERKFANTKVHDQALRKMQQTVRYLAKKNEEIAEKSDLCQRLAIGDVIMMTDS